LHCQQPEKDKQNVNFAPLGKISADGYVTERPKDGYASQVEERL